jgi:hypothetical protein
MLRIFTRRDCHFIEVLQIDSNCTSTNHSEIIALYEVSCECAWLHRVINHIQVLCGIELIGSLTIMYENNAACVAQI